jgi:uncharacterized protein with GYD domain
MCGATRHVRFVPIADIGRQKTRATPPHFLLKSFDHRPSPYYYARRNNHKSQREVSMIRLVTRGRFTRDYAKGLIAAPEDREPVVRKLIEGAGGKLVNFYFTTGDADFLLITETNEAESAIAALLATAAAGTISDVTTSRAWTGAEFKAVADKASKVASLYSPPGKK